MTSLRLCSIAIVLASAAALTFVALPSAEAAKKKISYDDAWAKCQQDVRANVPGENTASAPRYARAGACMKKYGYRLKKSSM